MQKPVQTKEQLMLVPYELSVASTFNPKVFSASLVNSLLSTNFEYNDREETTEGVVPCFIRKFTEHGTSDTLSKNVHIRLVITSNQFIFEIKDETQGKDWQSYQNIAYKNRENFIKTHNIMYNNIRDYFSFPDKRLNQKKKK